MPRVYSLLICAIFALCISAPLSSCGLRPVYGGAGKSSGGVSASLPPITLSAPRSRPGQLYRIELENSMPRTLQDNAAYRLSVSLEENRYPIGIEQSGRISRYNINYILTYQLLDTESGEVLDDGIIRKLSSYNIVPSDYASYVARRDAEKRAIAETAEETRKRLMLYFAKKTSSDNAGDTE